MDKNRCTRCIMPAEYPGITFNDEGVCSHCAGSSRSTENNRTNLLGKDKLVELIRSVEKKGQYDCVIPLSGGKDSMYVLYYVVKELGLKPVAVTYDSGYRTDIAEENVKNACDALNVPCVIEKANKKMQDRMLKDSLRISQTLGSFVLTCLSCDTIIKAIPIKVAKEKNIPFVFFGETARESVRLTKIRSKLEAATYQDVRSRSLITSLVEMRSQLQAANMTPLKFARILPRLLRYRLLTAYQLLSLGMPLRHALFPNLGSVASKAGLHFVYFYDYIDWDPVKGLAILEAELGWKHPPNRKSRFDCRLNCFGGYGALQKGGISGNGLISCNLIREGLLSREEALEAEEWVERTVEKECMDVIDQLDLESFVFPGSAKANHKLCSR